MKLRDYMVREKLTYQAVADAVGVNVAQIHRWANGTTMPPIRQTARLAKVTNGEVTANDFMDLDS